VEAGTLSKLVLSVVNRRRIILLVQVDPGAPNPLAGRPVYRHLKHWAVARFSDSGTWSCFKNKSCDVVCRRDVALGSLGPGDRIVPRAADAASASTSTSRRRGLTSAVMQTAPPPSLVMREIAPALRTRGPNSPERQPHGLVLALWRDRRGRLSTLRM
jgi:hypothetical protein